MPDSCCKQPEEGCGRLEPRFWFEQVSVRFPPSASHSGGAEDHYAALSALVFFVPFLTSITAKKSETKSTAHSGTDCLVSTQFSCCEWGLMSSDVGLTC